MLSLLLLLLLFNVDELDGVFNKVRAFDFETCEPLPLPPLLRRRLDKAFLNRPLRTTACELI
ncbi:unnamed protein product [Schistosoma mattheei]|uniref:Uncharacterized protein n=1 Tax=Schistosoma mattheei TaxID=31246 RepID=A0A3P7YCE5_9TREM|nr:unnamed protein product [Schistosoma mattheei]